jgi:methylene-fatty-acyl-phospholipid synthase
MSSANFLDYVDYTKPSFLHALGCIVIAPIIWNIIARLEFYTRFLTKITTSPYVGCYLLALWIFSFSLYRDFMYVFDLTAPPPLPFSDASSHLRSGPNFVSRRRHHQFRQGAG